MQEFLTAVWLEAVYQIFRRERGTELARRAWFIRVVKEIERGERSRVYN
jgi:hypothetical protein